MPFRNEGGGYQRFDAEGAACITSLNRAFRDDFSKPSLNADYWSITLGAGMTTALAGGELTINAGVVPNAETVLRCKIPFIVPFRAWFIGRISQRIVNQEVFFELVSADGAEAARWKFEGGGSVLAKYQTTNGSVGTLSASATVPSSSSDLIYETQLFPDEVWFGVRSVNSANGVAYSFANSANIPDPNTELFLQIRVKNLAVAPASNTAVTIGAIAAQDINELTAEITGGQGHSSAARQIPVTVTGGGMYGNTPTSNAGFSTLHKLISASSVNATLVSAVVTTVGYLQLFNAAATVRYFKLYNKSTAPVVGTDTPVLTIPLPPGQLVSVPIPAMGLRFSTGLGYAITAGLDDTDATAVAANDVVVALARA